MLSPALKMKGCMGEIPIQTLVLKNGGRILKLNASYIILSIVFIIPSSPVLRDSRVCRQIILSQIIVTQISVDYWIVVARSVSDEAIQRLWIAAPLIVARDDEIYDFWHIPEKYTDKI